MTEGRQARFADGTAFDELNTESPAAQYCAAGLSVSFGARLRKKAQSRAGEKTAAPQIAAPRHGFRWLFFDSNRVFGRNFKTDRGFRSYDQILLMERNAFSTTFSAVKPNISNSLFAGPLAPKVVMPMISPQSPAYLYQE